MSKHTYTLKITFVEIKREGVQVTMARERGWEGQYGKYR